MPKEMVGLGQRQTHKQGPEANATSAVRQSCDLGHPRWIPVRSPPLRLK